MTENSLLRKSSPAGNLDEIVEGFEANWSPAVDLSDHLPAPDVPQFVEIACELIRIDLEYRWRSGEPRLVESYLPLFGSHPLDPQQLLDLAFEEFRVRTQFDRPVDPEIYRQRLGIDPAGWQIPSLGAESHRPGEILQDFPAMGERFLNFDLLAEIGRGAVGRVCLARQTDLANRVVVVKISRTDGNEPETLARLQHTNIIPIFSRQRQGNLECICMPLLGLVTLRDLLGPGSRSGVTVGLPGIELISTVARRLADTLIDSAKSHIGAEEDDVRHALEVAGAARMPAIAKLDRTETLLWMGSRLADAMDYAHSKGIVHGDIKPANVLVSDDGQPILLDFHLAQRLQNQEPEAQAGGTLPYMSSTHLLSMLDGRKLTRQCDIFGLGAILYEGLTGHHPFPVFGFDRDSIQRMATDRATRHPDLTAVRRVSPAVAAIIEHCLAEPNRSRYQTARQVAQDLENQLNHRPLEFAPDRSIRERCFKFSKRHPRLTSTAVLVSVFVILVFAGVALIQSQLRQSAAVLARDESQTFVDEINRLVRPLTAASPESTNVEPRRRALLERLQALSPAPTRRLDLAQQTAENNAINQALYWLGSSYLQTAKSQADLNAQSTIATAAVKEIEAVRASGLSAAQPLERVVQELRHLSGAVAQSSSSANPTFILETPPPGTDSVSRLLRIAEARASGQDQAAILQAEQLLADSPGETLAWLLKGHSHLRLGEREKAEICYTFCIRQDETSAWGYFYRGLAELAAGRYDAAQKDFTEYIDREPTDASGYLNRALARRGLNDVAGSIEDFSAAIDLKCPQTRAYFLRSQMYHRAGKLREAQSDLETFLQTEPRDELSWISRGLAHAQQQDFVRARADFQTAAALNPLSRDALQNLATIDAEVSKNLPQAIAFFDQMLELDRADPLTWVTRGVLLARLARREEAQRDASQALRLSNQPDIAYRAAGVYALTAPDHPTDRQAAIRLLQQAARMEPHLVWSRATTDSDLDPLRSDREFQELMEMLQRLFAESRTPQSPIDSPLRE